MIEILNKLMFKRNKDEKYVFFREECDNFVLFLNLQRNEDFLRKI